eukprot:COSAG04_NODE_9431_length_865_cov_0.808094_3_plen_66_part_01
MAPSRRRLALVASHLGPRRSPAAATGAKGRLDHVTPTPTQFLMRTRIRQGAADPVLGGAPTRKDEL